MKIYPIDTQKGLLFTDIHYGAADSDRKKGLVHNIDNDKFVDYIIQEIRADKEIDSIWFLGDWNQHRTAINLQTLKYAYEGMKKLDELGLPIYIVLGNHDLYKKNDRSIHSLHFFEQFENVVLIEDPTVMKQKDEKRGDILFVPFLMHSEETDLMKFLDIPIWFGHFEFNGYEVTGYGMEMHGGLDPNIFKKPDIIVSGHFHKRQSKSRKNVVYMGNPFPTNYGDAGDDNRGYATYDFRKPAKKAMEFFNWEDGPRYLKTTLTALEDGDVEIDDRCYVKCVVDQQITYEESAELQKYFQTTFNPREFSLEESSAADAAVTDTVTAANDGEVNIDTIDSMVTTMLNDVDVDSMDNKLLVAIYKGLEL